MNKNTESIFDSPSQKIEADPEAIRLLSDRVLIRDLADAEKIGALYIPEIAQKRGVGNQGLLRLGIVVAVGPGDKFSEHGLDAEGNLRRRLLTEKCPECEGGGKFWDIRAFEHVICPHCDKGRRPVVVPAQCQPGDRVIYDARKEAKVYLHNVVHYMVHAEQAVWAVVEE